MSRIAILDTMIDPRKLNSARRFYHYSVIEKTDDYGIVNEYSHGTACACILDHLTENYDLYNIEILPDMPVHQGKPKGSVRDMKKGASSMPGTGCRYHLHERGDLFFV